MLGLGFPQLILILAGLSFMAAGIYGLAPSLVTAWGSGPAAKLQQRTGTTRDRKQAQQVAATVRPVEAPAMDVIVATPPSAPAKPSILQSKPVEAKPFAPVAKLEVKPIQAAKPVQVQVSTAKPVAKAPTTTTATPNSNAFFAPKSVAPAVQPVAAAKPAVAPAQQVAAAPVAKTPVSAAVPAKATEAVVQSATPVIKETPAVAQDPELVEELFAEMFSLRATVADLVGEVHQLRSEHRPRRFVIEEV